MTVAQLAAMTAAGAGVYGVWAVGQWLQAAHSRGVVSELVGAIETGTATDAERRRLIGVLVATLGAAGWLLGGCLLAGLGAISAPICLRVWSKRRKRRFRDQMAVGMPSAARAIADAMTGGHTLTSALEQAALSTGGPPAQELRRASQLTQLGEPADVAIHAMRERAEGRGWEAMASAILIQRQAGGDLAGLLRTLATAAEDSGRAEATARAALTQARATAQLISGLPLLALIAIAVLNPATIVAMVGNPIALMLAVVSAGLGLLAGLLLLKLARSVDVA